MTKRLPRPRVPIQLGKLIVHLSTGGVLSAAILTATPAFALDCSNIELRKMLMEDMNSTPFVQSKLQRMVDVMEPETIVSDRGDGNFVCSYLINASNGEKMRMRISFSKNSLGQIIYKIVEGE